MARYQLRDGEDTEFFKLTKKTAQQWVGIFLHQDGTPDAALAAADRLREVAEEFQGHPRGSEIAVYLMHVFSALLDVAHYVIHPHEFESPESSRVLNEAELFIQQVNRDLHNEQREGQ